MHRLFGIAALTTEIEGEDLTSGHETSEGRFNGDALGIVLKRPVTASMTSSWISPSATQARVIHGLCQKTIAD